MLSDEELLALAPAPIRSTRETRYSAADQAVALDHFGAADRDLLSELYAFLGRLQAVALDPNDGLQDAALAAFVAANDLNALLRRVQRLGTDPETRSDTRNAAHDIRGGALTPVFAELSHLRRGRREENVARAVGLLAHDQRKIMRNVVLDLDAAARANDLALKLHSTLDLARTLREYRAYRGDEPVSVDVDCRVQANLAESCVELGAIDRVALNLVNNAARYGRDAAVAVAMVRVGGNLRVVVTNGMEDGQREVIRATLLEGAVSSLPDGFSTTGSGLGLRIVSELVGNAFGILSHRELVRGGVVGARVAEDQFVTWFHWPLVVPDAPGSVR